MAIMLDTSFYFALISKKDTKHKRAQSIFKEIITGVHGEIYTSDYIFDESMTLLNVRTYGKRKDLLEKMSNLFIGDEPIAKLIKIRTSWFSEIVKLQSKLTKSSKAISFTDSSSIILCQKHQINKIVTFDDHFKGILILIQ